MSHSYLERRFSRNCCWMFILALILCCLGGVSQAQYTHQLTNTMASPQGGAAIAAAAIDETVVLLTDDGGLWALRQTGESYTTNAYLPIADRPRALGVSFDGTIYLGNEGGVLSAYTLSRAGFQQVARIQCLHAIYDLAVSHDGTVFIAAGMQGLAAYRLEGGALLETARIYEGGDVRTVAVGPDGIVYIASRNEPYVGAYLYNGVDFMRIGRHDGGPRMANDMAVSDDRMVLVADLVEGLVMYRFDGAELMPLAQVTYGEPGNGVAIVQAGRVYFACGPGGMRVYEIAGEELLPRAHWSGADNDARSVAAGVHETVLLANGMDGLRAFEPDVRCIAHQPAGYEALGVAVGRDGTIFAANGADGLVAYRAGNPVLQCVARTNFGGSMPIFARAVAVDVANRVYVAHDQDLSVYSYTDGSFKFIAHRPALGPATGIALDRWGRIYLACGEQGLQVFELIGADLHEYAQVNDGGKAMDVTVSQAGTVFVASGMDGLRAYMWSGPRLFGIAHINDGGGSPDWACRIAVAADNTVFLAGGRDGLRAYRFGGGSFVPTAHLDFPLSGEAPGVTALDIGLDGTIFFGCSDALTPESDGLFACRYNGATFVVTAFAEHAGIAADVAVAPDGMVFLADRRGGVLGYVYEYAGAEFPAIVVNPLSVDFGSLIVGNTARRYILLSNAGTGMLHVQGFQLIPTNGAEFSVVNPWPTELPAGASMRVCVQCTPRTTGIKEATLRILSDDPEHPMFDIPVRVTVGTSPISWGQLPTVSLWQNIPNPFNPSTEISFFLPQAEHIRLTVYDIAGRQIAVLVDAQTPAGWHSARFDGSKLPSGIYLYRLEAGANTMTRRMLLLN